MGKYYLGLDMGTNSIGWAVTDENYNIPKFKGNAMWGIRLFDESETAADRRTYRSQRRRTERNKFRQECLEILFNNEIAKKDIAFFQRLEDSNLYIEDKNIEGRFSLFNDKDFTDKDFHVKYPTQYHLRKELIENDRPHDVRLVFLAISHIIKNRGHFLFDFELNANESKDFVKIWENLSDYCKENYDFELNYSRLKEIGEIIKDKYKNKKNKLNDICKLACITKKDNPREYAVINLVIGGKVNAKDLFGDDSYEETEAKSITLSSGYDVNAPKYESILGENFELIEKIKAVYDWSILADILNGEEYLSYAKVKTFEEHKKDLAMLKSYVKKYCVNLYDDIFKKDGEKTNNYLAYSKHSNGKTSPNNKNCSQEDFCKYLSSLLPKECLDDEYTSMYEKINNNIFMPKVRSKENSVIPMQINREELVKILDNAEKYLSFLNDKDENNKTVKEKIIDIFNYRIPYYVGPLNSHSKFSWLDRTNEKIYPWNFEKVVDVDSSAEKFIENLTSKCTYLPMEDVIPKESLLYSTYSVLNELNNLKIDGEKPSVQLKQDIYNNLFLRRNKVTQKALSNYLKKILNCEDIIITGIDGDFKSNLKSHRDLAEFSSLAESQKEEIIKAITIFGDDKKLLKGRLKRDFGEILSNDEITKISKLKYSGWGRFSRKLLLEVEGALRETGEVLNIIRAMWETNNNLMEILSSENTFMEEIDKLNQNKRSVSLKEEIDSLYVSPKIKRPIYQAVEIVKEIVKIQGCEPDKIFIEVARGPEGEKNNSSKKGNRTSSRKSTLIKLYKSCKKDTEDLLKLLESYKDSDLQRDALYLYFTQMGKCMYTDQTIEIEDLFNRNLYDIDHIYPQSKIKDDSLDNRVLVRRQVNESKTDKYPIDGAIRNNQKDFWATLKKKGLISNEKFARLMRNTPLTDEELGGFIQRQIVETRQSTKATAEILKSRFVNSTIVYSKAKYVSEFRQQFDMVKCREVNDFHHAKDAYLNIVVGNVYNCLFNINNKANYVEKLKNNELSMNRIFDYNVRGAWKVENGNKITLKTVKDTMRKNNIRYTRYASKQKGGLFDQTIQKKGSGQAPLKLNSPLENIDKYGGYNKVTATYFVIAEYKNNKGVRTVCNIPIDLYREKEYLDNPNLYIETAIKESIDKKADLNSVKILIPCLKYNSLVSLNGFRMHISCKMNQGKVFSFKSAMQLVLSYEDEKYIKAIKAYVDKCVEYKKDDCYSPFNYLLRGHNSKIFKKAKKQDITDKSYKDFYSLSTEKQLVATGEIIEKAEINSNSTITFDEHGKYVEKLREYLKNRDLSIFVSMLKEKNLVLYDILIDKICNTIFNAKFYNVGNTLQTNRDGFLECSFKEQCCTLLNIIIILHNDARKGDLTYIGGSKNEGTITIGNKICMNEDNHSFKIIYQSVTGLYEKEIELLK